MAGVEAVAGAGDVEIAARVRWIEAVVDRVVEAAEAERRPGVVGFGGVVVDDIQDDFQAGGVERAHHALEFADRAGSEVAPLGREEADRVVAPVVAQAVLHQAPLVDERLHRQQLHRGDAEALEIFDHRAAGESGVGAAELFGHVGMALGEALDVELVDDGVLPRRARRPVVAPAKGAVDDLGAPEARADLADDQFCVRVEEELRAVEAMAALLRAVDAVAVEQARTRVRQVAVPDEVGALAELDALELAPAARVEEAELDARCVLGKEREVDPGAVPGRAERMRAAAPDGARGNDGSCGRLHRRRKLTSEWSAPAARGGSRPRASSHPSAAAWRSRQARRCRRGR